MLANVPKKGLLPWTPASASFLDGLKDNETGIGVGALSTLLSFENAGVNWTPSDHMNCLVYNTFG